MSLPSNNHQNDSKKMMGNIFIESPQIIIAAVCFFIWICSHLKHTDREIDVFILVNRNDNLKDKNMYLLRYGSTHKLSPYRQTS